MLFRLLGLLLIVQMAVATAFQVSFLHLHRLPDGRLVCHSHAVPHHSGSGNTHHHTGVEFLFYHFTTVLKTFLPVSTGFHSAHQPVFLISSLLSDHPAQIDIDEHYSRRAPPQFNPSHMVD
jgi:hypothetical protein